MDGITVSNTEGRAQRNQRVSDFLAEFDDDGDEMYVTLGSDTIMCQVGDWSISRKVDWSLVYRGAY